MQGCKKYILVIAAALMSLYQLHAQPKSLGTSVSFRSIGIVYEHGVSFSNSFAEISLKAETAEIFSGIKTYPGISASMTWNIIFKEWDTSEGNHLRLFAGPGAILGYASDLHEPDGFIFGIKGRVGAECIYKRNVSISIGFSPVIGSHIVNLPDHFTMKLYKNGLIYSIIPELGIKYIF